MPEEAKNRELLVTSLHRRIRSLQLESSLNRISNLTKTLKDPRCSDYRVLPVQTVRRSKAKKAASIADWAK